MFCSYCIVFYCVFDLPLIYKYSYLVDSSIHSLVDSSARVHSVSSTVDASLLPGHKARLRARQPSCNFSTSGTSSRPPCTGLKVSLLFDQHIDDREVVDLFGEPGPELLHRLVGVHKGAQRDGGHDRAGALRVVAQVVVVLEVPALIGHGGDIGSALATGLEVVPGGKEENLVRVRR